MLYVTELLLLLVISVTYSFASLDTPIQPLKDGSKSAFIRPPVNTIKIQTELELQDDVSVHWPNGIVNYYVDNGAYDIIFGRVILTAFKIIERSSCVIFKDMKQKPLVNMTWIHITNRRKERECNHRPRFMDSGEIELVFGYDCLKTEEILHTILHGIGFKDEVTHPHRDKYIRVLWDNIHPVYQHLYRKQAEKSSKTLVEYDPLSVMHFHDRAFSRNGQATIAPLEPGLLIYPSRTLSQLDKMRLQMYFSHECNKRKVTNLLQTCEKSLGGQGGKEMLANEKSQGAYSSDENSDYDAENKTNKTENDEYKSTEKERLYAEDGRENETEEEITEEQEEDIEGQDVKDISGKIEESQNIESENIEDQDIEGQDTEGQDTDRQNTVENIGQNENDNTDEQDRDEYDVKNYDSEKEDIENKDGESTNDINASERVDEEYEETTKDINVDTENSDETKSMKERLTANAYEKNISEHTSTETNLKLILEQELSETDSGKMIDVSYNKKMKYKINKLSLDSEINDKENEVFRR